MEINRAEPPDPANQNGFVRAYGRSSRTDPRARQLDRTQHGPAPLGHAAASHRSVSGRRRPVLGRRIELIDDVFVRLVATIEQTSRALLAIRLGPVAVAPPKILRVLACDDAIEVASPVLTQAERLDIKTLIECARTKKQEHLLAISRRKTLPEVLTEVLVERGDQQVVLSTAKNNGARFSAKGFDTLIMRSRGDDALTTCVGLRSDLPPQLFDR